MSTAPLMGACAEVDAGVPGQHLGLVMLAAGEAVAFGSVPALVAAGAALTAILAWRARVEERLLLDVFGERYRAYRTRTCMLIPYLL
jgi:protein-S-isoprenylcysteine O-methyltransferase Ste14